MQQQEGQHQGQELKQDKDIDKIYNSIQCGFKKKFQQIYTKADSQHHYYFRSDHLNKRLLFANSSVLYFLTEKNHVYYLVIKNKFKTTQHFFSTLNAKKQKKINYKRYQAQNQIQLVQKKSNQKLQFSFSAQNQGFMVILRSKTIMFYEIKIGQKLNSVRLIDTKKRSHRETQHLDPGKQKVRFQNNTLVLKQPQSLLIFQIREHQVVRQLFVVGQYYFFNSSLFVILNQVPHQLLPESHANNLSSFQNRRDLNLFDMINKKNLINKVNCSFATDNNKYIALGFQDGTIKLFKKQNKKNTYRLQSLILPQFKSTVKQIIAIHQNVLLSLNQDSGQTYICIWSIKFKFCALKIKVHKQKEQKYYVAVFDNKVHVYIRFPNSCSVSQYIIYDEKKRYRKIYTNQQDPGNKIVYAFIKPGQKEQDERRIIVIKQGDLDKFKLKQSRSTYFTMHEELILVIDIYQEHNSIKVRFGTLHLDDKTNTIKFELCPQNKHLDDNKIQKSAIQKLLSFVKNGYFIASAYSSNNQKPEKNSALSLPSKYRNVTTVYYLEQQTLKTASFEQVQVREIVPQVLFMRSKKVLFYRTDQHGLYIQSQKQNQSKLLKTFDEIMFITLNNDQSILYVGLKSGCLSYDTATGLWFRAHNIKQLSTMGRISGDLILLSHMEQGELKQPKYVYEISDLRWKQLIFRKEFSQDVTCKLMDNSLLQFDSDSAAQYLYMPDSQSTLQNFFQMGELVTIKAIADGYLKKEHSQQLALGKGQMLVYYFNTAVLFDRFQVVQALLPRHRLFRQDGLILEEDPINYSMKAGFTEISKVMLEMCSSRMVYPEQLIFQGISPEYMNQFLVGQFREVKSGQLRTLGFVQDSLLPAFSTTRHSYCINFKDLVSADGNQQAAIRLVELCRPLDLQRGNQSLLKLLQIFSTCLNNQTIRSDAMLLIQYLHRRNSLIYKVERLFILLIVTVNVLALFLQLNSLYILGTVLLCLNLVLRLFMFHSYRFFSVVVPLFVIVNNLIFLNGVFNLVVTFIAFVLLLASALFSLHAANNFHYLFRVFFNIGQELVPFAFLMGVSVILLGININFLAPIEAEFKDNLFESMMGVFFGSSSFDNFPEEQQPLFVRWFVLFMRQFLLSIFMLNGILVGIVTGMFMDYEEQKLLINSQSIIQHLIRYQVFFSRLAKLGLIENCPQYLHAFVTTKEAHKADGQEYSEYQQYKQQFEAELYQGQNKINSQLDKLRELASQMLLKSQPQKQKKKVSRKQRRCTTIVKRLLQRKKAYNVEYDATQRGQPERRQDVGSDKDSLQQFQYRLANYCINLPAQSSRYQMESQQDWSQDDQIEESQEYSEREVYQDQHQSSLQDEGTWNQ